MTLILIRYTLRILSNWFLSSIGPSRTGVWKKLSRFPVRSFRCRLCWCDSHWYEISTNLFNRDQSGFWTLRLFPEWRLWSTGMWSSQLRYIIAEVLFIHKHLIYKKLSCVLAVCVCIYVHSPWIEVNSGNVREQINNVMLKKLYSLPSPFIASSAWNTKPY